MLAGFCFNNISFLRRHKFGCIDSFLRSNSRNEEMRWVMVSFGATAAGLRTVNVCVEHYPVISRAAQYE